MDNLTLFPTIIGQNRVKRKLEFYLKAFQRNSTMPFLLFEGAKGSGKTELATQLANELNRKVVVYNCGTTKKFEDFYDEIFTRNIMQQDCAIVLDEIHYWLPTSKIVTNLLTILNPNARRQVDFRYQGGVITIDYTRHSFFACTTEPQKLFPPLRNRFQIVATEEYTYRHLFEIFNVNLDNITIDPALIKSIGESIANPREAVRLATQISDYLLSIEATEIDKGIWDNLAYDLDILPLGLNRNELTILKMLHANKEPARIHQIQSVTGLDKNQISSYEKILFKHGLIKSEIEGRRITYAGRKYLEKLEEMDMLH